MIVMMVMMMMIMIMMMMMVTILMMTDDRDDGDGDGDDDDDDDDDVTHNFVTQLCHAQLFHTICLPPSPLPLLPFPSHLPGGLVDLIPMNVIVQGGWLI